MKRDPLGKLALGLATGTAFGAFLQRGGASDADLIMSQLLLRDGAVARIMSTAAAAGSIGTHTLRAAGATELDVKPFQVRSVILGGVAFGAGMAVLGYCPGTTLAAVGEGRRDAMFGLLGMVAGALAFIRVYPHIKEVVEATDLGKVTVPSATKTSPWPWVAGLAGLAAAAALVSRVRAAR
ncbi:MULTISPECIES: DUF6691 family protein [Sorangium]|uniref:YeeE/YedE thiosulfate transporter family protein n=1 Tax=Sorangium atrum TaxID=2995308 RepID=A0ABT5BUJ4_9BACT|nr:DUF6691 family protein [Sorangium aterium]MDC0677821.1 YeeE/YedE thiosulfate transporter family protein [Sorangium aterium]